jgi:cyclopropane fatty-acyl-phospholipid synthase-like methyltransferase
LIKLAYAQPKRILDFGCGHGRVMRHIRAEYPDAVIVGCDLKADALDFCADSFGALPVKSDPDPTRINLQGEFDVIWAGSVFTHLRNWDGFLDLLRRHLNGAFVFTTAGERVIQEMKDGESFGMRPERVQSVLEEYERTGFGYHEDKAGNGFARSSPEWVRKTLAARGFSVRRFTEAGWDQRQDVWIAE